MGMASAKIKERVQRPNVVDLKMIVRRLEQQLTEGKLTARSSNA
jgi:hypothetical protein